MPDVITQQVSMTLVGTAKHIHGTFTFDPDNPLQVSLLFRDGARPVWVFDRELLLNGRHRPYGLGDIRVSPGHDPLFTHIRVTVGQVTAEVAIPRASVDDFILAAYVAVRPAEEDAIQFADMDAELDALLDEAAS